MTSNLFGQAYDQQYQYGDSFHHDLGYGHPQANSGRTTSASNNGFSSNDNPYANVVSASLKSTGFVGPNPVNFASQTSTQASVSSENKPRILLLGLRRSGKTSILKVVFHKMSPNETLFLESTNKIIKSDISNSTFIQFQIWDFPGQFEISDNNSGTNDGGNIDTILMKTGAIIFVIDTQDDYLDSLNKLHTVTMKALKINPNIFIEVFIHKSDGLSDDVKIEKQREIQQQATELLESSLSPSDGFNSQLLSSLRRTFYLTSIYDHSIYEAFSKVSQKLIPQLPTLENLLDILISNCRMEKAFLIDVVSKIYVATDSNPVDMQSYELASDMIDVVVDVSSIYGTTGQSFPASPKEDSLTDQKNSSSEKQTQNRNQFSQIDYSDDEAQSIIKLNNGMVLYLREVNKYLALVCLLRADNFDKHGLIDYNFQCFKKAISEVFKHMLTYK